MTVGISIDRVLEEIYAVSALRNYMMVKDGDVSDCPAVLHEGHAEALKQVVRRAISYMVIKLSPWVVACDMAEDGSDVVSVVIEGDQAENYGEVIRAELEAGVEAMVMHICLLGSDNESADEYLAKAKDASVAIEGIMNEQEPDEGYITGHWIA
jgi:hypothetical protein